MLIDAGLQALNPEEGTAVTNILLRRRIEALANKNPAFDITSDAYAKARDLLSQGRFGELDQYLKGFER